MPTRERPQLQNLEGADFGSWGGFLQTHARLVGRLDAEMRAAHGLSLSAYEVLMRLGRADGERLRMHDLAASVLLSPSGITRVVDRLERAGFVTRCGDERDGRGRLAVLTDSGYRKLVDAQRTHLAGVREAFLDRLTSAEREQLAAVWRHLAGDPPN
jgi:DNA-binding MarR family transcriptional regulator